jgi:hypothetical protein
MRRINLVTVATLATAIAASSASAVCIDTTAHYVKSGYRRNVCWPYPYICPDRMAVREPFEMMIRNGWRRENLLGAYMFNPSTNQLTTAGELHVRWIMTQAPHAYRQVFIERSIDPAVTAERLAATRQFAARVSTDGQLPEVFETDLMAEGRPAAIVDATNVKFMENMPLPVLPAAEALDQ